MRTGTPKRLERKNQDVVRMNVEIYEPVYNRMVDWCATYGWSKRKLMEDAVTCWLNARDMEKQAREAAQGVK